MSPTTPPPEDRAKRFLFDGTKLTEVPAVRRRVRQHKAQRHEELRDGMASDVETSVSPTFRLVEPAMPFRWTDRMRSRRSRGRLRLLAAVALGGGGALLLVWFATRSGESPSGASSPALEAAAVEEEGAPAIESQTPTITFAAPRAVSPEDVRPGAGGSHEEGPR